MSKLDCTWEGDAKDKGKPLIANTRLLQKYLGFLENAKSQRNSNRIAYWQIRIKNLKNS